MAADRSDGDHDSSRYCGAKKRQGEGTCTRPAGWGTKHAGTGCCKLHGGSTGTQTVRAERVRVEAETKAVLADLGVAPVGDPLRALLDLAGQTLAWQQATAALVNRLDGVRYAGMNGSEQLRAEVGLYERAMDRASSVLSAIARLNIEDRVARISEHQADVVTAAVVAGLTAAGLTGDQLITAQRAAAQHLREHAG
ncbi:MULTISPECIES: hypothetical protein [Streptomyces]|uniref:Uncharacterized protein n=1 Tax=Streptomyces flavovirens TaxID=52258 RepID=A0ABV8NEV5_9ACTN|nr:hypothetical protein [Streptomyces sp. MBT51]MBK3596733.1 hypothetical protein [Streptomyces sp. MBT51]